MFETDYRRGAEALRMRGELSVTLGSNCFLSVEEFPTVQRMTIGTSGAFL